MWVTYMHVLMCMCVGGGGDVVNPQGTFTASCTAGSLALELTVR